MYTLAIHPDIAGSREPTTHATIEAAKLVAAREHREFQERDFSTKRHAPICWQPRLTGYSDEYIAGWLAPTDTVPHYVITED